MEISKEQLVIRHIGRDAGVLYEFRKPPNSQSGAGTERLGFSDS
jgi:hypothetical protein